MTNISEMTKEDYIQWRANKVNLPVEDVTALWEEYAEEGKLIGEQDVDLYVKKRFGQAFIKKDKGFGKNPTVPVKLIIVGFQETDYGAERQYNESMKLVFNDDGSKKDADVVQSAIDNNFVNEELQPLFHFENSTNKKNGTVIDLVKELQVSFTVIAQRTDKESEFLKGTLAINKAKLESFPKLFTVYETEATIGTKSDDKEIVLYGDDRTTFTQGKELQQEQVDSLIQNFFKDVMFPMTELVDVALNYPKPNSTRFNSFVMTRACIADINITREGINNKILLADGLDEDAFSDTWVPEQLPINFSNTAQNVWVYGTVSYDQTNAIPIINVQGMYVPEQYRITEEPKPVQPQEEKVEAKPVVEEVKTPTVEKATNPINF